jgi:hypothetical protein
MQGGSITGKFLILFLTTVFAVLFASTMVSEWGQNRDTFLGLGTGYLIVALAFFIGWRCRRAPYLPLALGFILVLMGAMY